jgi:hypothetical protein
MVKCERRNLQLCNLGFIIVCVSQDKSEFSGVYSPENSVCFEILVAGRGSVRHF